MHFWGSVRLRIPKMTIFGDPPLENPEKVVYDALLGDPPLEDPGNDGFGGIRD